MVADHLKDRNPWLDPVCEGTESKSTVKNDEKWKIKTPKGK